jgi:hypothetical protein
LSQKSCFTCLIPVCTAGYQRGGIYPGTVKVHVVSCLSVLQCCAERVLRLRHLTCSLPPPHIWQKKRRLHRRELNHFIRQQRRLHLHPLVETLGSCTCMARGPLANDDMVMWMGKWQRKKKRAVCPDSRSQREGARGSRAGWLHEGELPFPDPAFFGVSGTVLGGMEQSVLSHGAHIRNSKVSIRSKCRWW